MNLQDVQGFPGFVNFYRLFISHFSSLITLLMALAQNNVPFRSGNKEKAAFEAIKRAVTLAPILWHFNPEGQIIVETGASNYAIRGVISQLGKDEEVHPIAFSAHHMYSAQLNYLVHDKEFLAIKCAFLKWPHYLKGAVHDIIVYTDHQTLEGFMTTKQLTRWQAC